jgi:hypothetical protein
VLARLAEAGLTVHGEPGARTDVERPVGHHTHNLLVKDKKSGDVFLVTHRQSAKANLADVAKKVGAKNLRLASTDTVTRHTLAFTLLFFADGSFDTFACPAQHASAHTHIPLAHVCFLNPLVARAAQLHLSMSLTEYQADFHFARVCVCVCVCVCG